MRADEVRYGARLAQVLRLEGLAIHHRVAIKPPGLAACPRARIRIALSGLPGVWNPALRVIRDHVEGAEIVAEMVANSRVRVSLGHPDIAADARLAAQEAQHLEIHHIVDDDRVLPLLVRLPGFDYAKPVIIAGQQALRTLADYVKIATLSRQAVALAEAAIKHKPEIVGIGQFLGGFNPVRKKGCIASQFLVRAVAVKLPQHAGEKARAPPAVVTGNQLAVRKAARQGCLLGGKRPGKDERLRAAEREALLYQFGHRLLGKRNC